MTTAHIYCFRSKKPRQQTGLFRDTTSTINTESTQLTDKGKIQHYGPRTINPGIFFAD